MKASDALAGFERAVVGPWRGGGVGRRRFVGGADDVWAVVCVGVGGAGGKRRDGSAVALTGCHVFGFGVAARGVA